MTVERVSNLHESELIDYMNEIKHSLRPSTPDEAEMIQQAVTLVRSGAIDSYKYDPSNETVTVKFNAEESAQVILSFNQLGIRCTCDDSGWCVHAVAVVFHLYLQFNSLTDWLHEWRRTEIDQMTFKISDRTPQAWNDVLSRLMNPIRTVAFMENPAVFIHKFSIIEQNAKPLIPFEWEWKPLFDVYFRWHALEAAWPYVAFHLSGAGTNFSYGKWYIKNWLTEQLGDLKSSVKSIASKPRLFETDPFYEELKGMARLFTLEKTGLFEERFQVFQIFWQYLFTNQALQNTERERLEKEEIPIASVLVGFFHILQKNETELAKLATNVDEDNFAHWLPLAYIAERENEIDSLAIVMEALLPFIGDYLKNVVPISQRSTFVRKIDGFLDAADFPEKQREEMFSYYGETGVDVYADFLVERERFNEWAALMHRYGVSYDVAEAGGLKIALANDPAAVLPLLHLYSMKFINERSRQSYRRAVNLFKKMKSGAKKSGKHDFWNRYLDTVREKNRRLRALMEEMEKGNLYL